MRVSRRSAILLGASSALAALSARAEPAYPSRPVRVVVTFSAGGVVDPPVRVVTAALGERIGQSIIIDNRGGAGGALGTTYVSQAAADGYTLLAANGSMTVSQAVYANLSWDAAKSFTYLGGFGAVPSILMVNAARVPARSLAEFIIYAKERPSTITYGTAGVGSASHLAGELMMRRCGIKLQHVPYKGAAPALNDLLAGTIDTMIAGFSSVVSNLTTPTIHPIFVTSLQRAPQAPQIPALAEAYPGFDFTNWLGFAAPIGVSDIIVRKFGETLRESMNDGALNRKLLDIGVTPGFVDAEGMLERVRQELAAYVPLVKEAGISVQ